MRCAPITAGFVIAWTITASAVARGQSLPAPVPAAQPAPASGPVAPPAPDSSSEPISNLAQSSSAGTGTKASLQLGGYVELFYQWNINNPSNGITNYRGYDNRHNSFTVSNVVFDALGTLDRVTAHLALQVGHTPESVYLAEPVSPGTSVVGASGPNVWKYIQQANVGYKAPLGRGVLFEAGIFLSPIGPEGIAVKDQWNWSRSSLFIVLPAYHTGLRATYAFTDRLSLSSGIFNGWNSVVDNNKEKSGLLQFTYNVPDHMTFNFVYFTGVERGDGAPEGRAWRHLFDAYYAVYPRPWLSLLVHGSGGIEPNNFGMSAWAAGALYVRVRPISWLYLAARGDFFYERKAANAVSQASAIFWPVSWVSSATATADFRPVDNLSLRVEYRHDQAAGSLYFKGDVGANPVTGLFAANASGQDTLTLGATAWF